MKRTFIIIAAIIVLVGIAIGIYFLFFNKQSASLSIENPFGNTGAGTSLPGEDGSGVGSGGVAGTEVAPRLIKIANGPVAEGAVAINHPAVSTLSSTAPAGVNLSSSTATTVSTEKPADTEVRYIERASGNVYSYFAHARTLTRISNKTLPGIQEASWLPDGSRAYARFLSNSGTPDESITTYALSADGATGYTLEQNLSEALVSGTSTLFSLLNGTNGSIGLLSKADGTNSRTLFSSVLSSLVVLPTSQNLFAHTKASSGLIGYGFSINRTSGAFTRILGGLRGLTLLPNPTGSMILYSYREQNGIRLSLYDVASHSATALPLATLTEKCVWAQNGKTLYCAVPKEMVGDLPDDWYQGAAAFTDRLWKIDLATRTANLLVDPSEVGKVSIDAVALTVDKNEDVLVFTEKASGSIWLYDL